VDRAAQRLGSDFPNYGGRHLGITKRASPNIGILRAPLRGRDTGILNLGPFGKGIWAPSWKSWIGSGFLCILLRVHETTAFLVLYVARMLFTAPPSHERALWKVLEARVNFDEEPAEISKFLGAHHNLSKSDDIATGRAHMKEFLLDAVSRYLSETGEKQISAARTPLPPPRA